MFNAECKLHKYETVGEIIDEFYTVRLQTYSKRKASLVKAMKQKLVRLSNRAKYIVETLEGVVDLRRKKNEEVVALLEGRGFVCIDGDYKYLTKMPMDSVTQENVDAILKEKAQTESDLISLEATACEQMWLKELDHFETEYAKYKGHREAIQSAAPPSTGKKAAKKVSTKK
jgi:DNA topoisomerase-2